MNRNKWSGPGHDNRAFTLLEVMIAIAIIAIAFTSLFGSQSHSLSLAAEAKFNTTASFLAQEKIAEVSVGIGDSTSTEGDFGDDFPGFTWELEIQQADTAELEILADLDRPLLRLDLTVSWQGELFSAPFTFYYQEEQE